MMEDPDYLREKAAQCFQLARLARDGMIRDELERLGREFEAEARKTEAKRTELPPSGG